MDLTCIMCPMGCSLKVEKKNGKIVVTGNSCPRGAIYGEKEVTAPERIVTSVKKYKSGTITLKSSSPVPKQLVDEVLKEIAKKREPKEIEIGNTFIKNVLKTGCDIVVTSINL